MPRYYTSRGDLIPYYQRAVNFAHSYACAVHGISNARFCHPGVKRHVNSTYRSGLRLFYRDNPL